MKPQALILGILTLAACGNPPQEQTAKLYTDRPPVEERAFISPAIDSVTEAVAAQITHPKLAEMFRKCFPNTLDTTVHYSEDENGEPDTYVYTGDIPAMWLRDSGAQVWPYLAFVNEDEGLRKTVDGTKELSDPIPEGTYATPAEAALHAAETAVTIWGDAVPACEIHVNMYTGNGLELVYYGIGFDGTPFESMEQIYGYVDAVTGTVLHLDCNHWGQSVQKYGNDTINGKVRDWSWDSEAYGAAHTSDKALSTAMELIRTCFPTGEIVPRDDAVWDAGSHTDGEQIGWNYVQVAVPLEEGAQPAITIFGCYPLGWDYCCNQIHDPAVLREELADLAAIRNSVKVNEGSSKERAYPVYDEKLLQERADYAKQWIGLKFYLSGNNSYVKEFVEEQGRERAISMAFIDISLGTADPWSVQWLDLSTPEDVIRCALPGQTLEFSGSGLWAVYVGDGQCVYAKAEPDEAVGVLTRAAVADMMQGDHCHLQINDYMTVSPAVEKLLDPNDN